MFRQFTHRLEINFRVKRHVQEGLHVVKEDPRQNGRFAEVFALELLEGGRALGESGSLLWLLVGHTIRSNFTVARPLNRCIWTQRQFRAAKQIILFL